MSSLTSTTESTGSAMQRLLERPYEFDFVQSVRQLYRHAISTKLENQRVGWDNFPEQEVVRFKVATTLRHTSSQIISAVAPDNGSCAYEVTIPFMGLIGANGVLPRHYTRMVIGRVKKHDYAMRDFFDLFHHRIVSNFFRASVKYRLPVMYEMCSMADTETDDSITQAIRCLIGLGDGTLKNRLVFPDDICLFFGGHFATKRPSAITLERMLTDFVGSTAEIEQFRFEWLYVHPSEQTSLSPGSGAQLGLNTVVGERVPSYQNRFRVRLGPLSWSEFSHYLPDSPQVNAISSFVRTYVGIGYDFDIQVAVHGSEIPDLELGGEQPSMLGWNSWILTNPMDGTVEDTVFEVG